MAAGVVLALAGAGLSFEYTWREVLGWELPERLTVLVLVGLLVPAAAGLFLLWFFLVLANRIRDPSGASDILEAPFLTQLVVVAGLLAGVAITAYDCFVVSAGLAPTRMFIAFFRTGVVPVVMGILAAVPFWILAGVVHDRLGELARREARSPRRARFALARLVLGAGALVAIAVVAAGTRLGWGMFLAGEPEPPGGFWIVLVIYAASVPAGFAYLPFHALARSIGRTADAEPGAEPA